MALTAGMTTSFAVGTAGGNREDLEDKIWDLYADDTWALTNLDKVEATGTYHEWLKDSLAAAGSNSALEGDEATFTTLTSPTRVGNYCRITKKTFLVSRTQNRVSKAGRSTESARQTVRKMRELKNDMEWAIVRGEGSAAGDVASARVSAGMESWMSTNQSRNGTKTAGTVTGFSSGIVASCAVATETAMSEGVLKSSIASAWAQGGDARVILTNTSTKSVVDGFTGVVTRNVDISRAQQATIIGAANLYVSSYGTHTVVVHRHIRAGTMLGVDPDFWSIAFLDAPFMEKLAKTGDGEKYQMIAEWTLVARNEASSFRITGIAT